LASAGEQASVTELQRTRLLELIAELPSVSDLLVHVDNSAGATVFDASGPWNAVRLGLMQYGCEPYDNTGFVLKPVLSAHARVGLVKSLRQGSAISYGGTHCLTRDSKVAIVTVGYADGLSRQLSNRGSMLIRGVRCPILGRVCMDLTILDVTDHPETIAPGDRVTWIGAQEAESIRVEELSHWAGTIPWECLCSLSRRVPRVYVG
jgi:alanine racemase